MQSSLRHEILQLSCSILNSGNSLCWPKAGCIMETGYEPETSSKNIISTTNVVDTKSPELQI